MPLLRVIACSLIVLQFALSGCQTKSPPTQTLDEWIRALRALVRNGDNPNQFLVPKAPVVTFPATADDIGRNVDQAAADFSVARDFPYDETKGVFCTWFAWYMETGRTLPSEEDFPTLLLEYVYGQAPIFTSQQVVDAADLLRTSIERGQSEGESMQNLATAAACSV